MSSRRYQQTLNRQQEMLLPCRVKEYVSKHNTVRAIDAYVDTLDMQDKALNIHSPRSVQDSLRIIQWPS